MYEPPMTKSQPEMLVPRRLELARAFGRGLWAPDDPVRWWHRLLGRKRDG